MLKTVSYYQYFPKKLPKSIEYFIYIIENIFDLYLNYFIIIFYYKQFYNNL